MARKGRKGGWPEKNPETRAFGSLTTPLSTTEPAGDPRPGYSTTVPENANPGNPVGYSGLEGGRGKRGRR